MMDFFDAFDIFNEAPAAVKEDAKETKKAPVKAEETKEEVKTEVSVEELNASSTSNTDVPFDENVEASIENEEDEEGLSTSDDEESKDSAKSSKKKAAPKKTDNKLKGVVKVVGNGWTTNYGEAGAEYEPSKVAKDLFTQGYKEIALATIKASGNKLFVNSINENASPDDINVGDAISIVLGNFRVNYAPSDFTGLSPEEISLFDVQLKFQADNPQFAGCGLKFDASAKVAVPVFTKKATIKPEQQYGVWTENGIQQYVGADIKDDDVYVSETGTYFLVEKAPKNASQVYHVDLGLDKVSTKKAVEVYRLPFTLWVETFGTNKPCTAEDFGGKESVTKDEIISYLGNAYRIFRSSTRRFSISYDRNSRVVGVAVVSGEKGAAKAVPFSSKVVNFFDYRERLLSARERVEETALGLFKGFENDEEMLSLDVFEMSLPKIPNNLFNVIVKEFKRDLTRENMVQIYWSVKTKSYYLVKPKATYDKISVRYQMTHTHDILVMSIHSHNTMPAIFSSTDDEDEVYTGLFGVVGNLDTNHISMSFRAGMEGKFKELYYEDIFTNGGDIA